MRKKFTFDDILLAPEYSNIEHGDVDITSDFFKYYMNLPILSSPMDTITGYTMILKL